MKNVRLILGITILSSLVLISCQNKEKESTKEISHIEINQPNSSDSTLELAYNIGDKVPNKQVCMVNNAYMAKDQIEVPHDGKTYYGCCNMCVERIPNDETARTAKDPFSGKNVDKSEAYIVLKDKAGNVDYFENEANYKKYNQQ